MSMKQIGVITLIVLLSLSVGVRGENDSITEREQKVEKTQHPKSLSSDLLWRDEVLIPWMAKQFFWPWKQLSQAVAAFDVDDEIERTSVKSDSNIFEIVMSVKKFKPDEIKLTMKNRYVVVTGKHVEVGDGNNKQSVTNQFEQRFALPPNAKTEEVSAKLENGVLTISAPIHPAPAPEPERDIPITIVNKKVENQIETEVKIENESTAATTQGTAVPVQFDSSTSPQFPSPTTNMVESSSYHGKIRKKDLKVPFKKVPKKTEASRNDESNNLELMEPAE